MFGPHQKAGGTPFQQWTLWSEWTFIPEGALVLEYGLFFWATPKQVEFFRGFLRHLNSCVSCRDSESLPSGWTLSLISMIWEHIWPNTVHGTQSALEIYRIKHSSAYNWKFRSYLAIMWNWEREVLLFEGRHSKNLLNQIADHQLIRACNKDNPNKSYSYFRLTI